MNIKIKVGFYPDLFLYTWKLTPVLASLCLLLSNQDLPVAIFLTFP